MPSRRAILIAGISATGLAVAAGKKVVSGRRISAVSDYVSDWPSWAPSRSDIDEALMERLAKAQDLRDFGARLDGITDDSGAFERALEQGASAVFLTGPARIGTPVKVGRAFAVAGRGAGPHIITDIIGKNGTFQIEPASGQPAEFVQDITFVDVSAKRGSATARKRGAPFILIRAANVRKMMVVRCRTEGVSLAIVTHQRLVQKLAKRRNRDGETGDPAVNGGFSPTALDDLNEDISIVDCDVDYGEYMGQILRFNFAKRVAVVGNVGNYANISWSGGGSKRSEGGDVDYLRRVSQVYIADNKVRGANGGIYGNRGRGVIVARNQIHDMTDVGIDFEGCVDCHAYDNHVENIANYGLATFYAAQNIVFSHNRVVQDGSAARMAEKLNGKRFGKPLGIYFAGMRSAGFCSKSDESILVSFVENEFIYKGKGVGGIVSSYFSKLIFEKNKLHNVAVDWRYPNTFDCVIRMNDLLFDRMPDVPITLVGASARNTDISENTITLLTNMPENTIGFGYQTNSATVSARITRNRIMSKGGKLPALGIDGDGAGVGSEISARNNVVGAVLLRASVLSKFDVAGNNDGGGTVLKAQSLIAKLPSARNTTTKPHQAEGGGDTVNYDTIEGR